MSAKTASDVFENAVNHTGVTKATGLVAEGGRIRIVASGPVQVSGTMEATDIAKVTSDAFVAVKAEFKTKGNTEIAAFGDVRVEANLTTQEGNLELFADKKAENLIEEAKKTKSQG